MHKLTSLQAIAEIIRWKWIYITIPAPSAEVAITNTRRKMDHVLLDSGLYVSSFKTTWNWPVSFAKSPVFPAVQGFWQSNTFIHINAAFFRIYTCRHIWAAKRKIKLFPTLQNPEKSAKHLRITDKHWKNYQVSMHVLFIVFWWFCCGFKQNTMCGKSTLFHTWFLHKSTDGF